MEYGLDLDLYAVISDYISTSDPNNSQMMDAAIDWGIHGTTNDFHPTIGAYTPSIAATNTTTTTFSPSIPIDNSQRVYTTIDGMFNGFQQNNITYSSSFVGDETELFTTPNLALNNVQMSNGSFISELGTIINSYPPTVGGASSTFFVEGTSTPFTIVDDVATTTTTNQAIPIGVYHQQNSYFQEDRLNVYPMNIDNINELLTKNHYPHNLSIRQNPPLTFKNCSVLSNPCHEKLPEPSIQKQPLVGQFPLDFSISSKIIGESSSSKDKQSMKEFRYYKLAEGGLNTDSFSWEAYGAKMTDDSIRTYYRCASRDDCMAKKRVERKRSDPSSVFVKHSNYHNHPTPSLMNLPGVRVNVVTGSTEVGPSAPVVSFMENTEHDNIYQGLGEFIDN